MKRLLTFSNGRIDVQVETILTGILQIPLQQFQPGRRQPAGPRPACAGSTKILRAGRPEFVRQLHILPLFGRCRRHEPKIADRSRSVGNAPEHFDSVQMPIVRRRDHTGHVAILRANDTGGAVVEVENDVDQQLRLVDQSCDHADRTPTRGSVQVF